MCLYEYIATLSRFNRIGLSREIWNQTIDCEHAPFRCHHFHELGHLFSDLSHRKNKQQGEGVKENDGFTRVTPKRWNARGHPIPAIHLVEDINYFSTLEVMEKDLLTLNDHQMV